MMVLLGCDLSEDLYLTHLVCPALNIVLSSEGHVKWQLHMERAVLLLIEWGYYTHSLRLHEAVKLHEEPSPEIHGHFVPASPRQSFSSKPAFNLNS